LWRRRRGTAQKLGQESLPGLEGNFKYLQGGENTFMPLKGREQARSHRTALHRGVIKHVGAADSARLMTVNSYRAANGQGLLGAGVRDWVIRNRTCALRHSAPGRFEYRSVDSTVHPYADGGGPAQGFEDGIST